MFVTGQYISRFAAVDDLTTLLAEVVQGALQDAELELKAIDAIYLANNLAPFTHHQSHLSAVLAGLMPGSYKPVFNLEAACGSGGMAVHLACAGLHRYPRVLVLGVEQMSGLSSSGLLSAVASDADRAYDQTAGLVFPAAGALVADAYLRKHGLTREQAFTPVALKNHAHGNLNPEAQFYGKKVDAATIDQSKEICSPLRLFDCSPNSDGAAAVVIEQQPRRRAPRILASCLVSNRLRFAGQKDLTVRPAMREAAKNAYQQSGLKPSQIDFAELHDAFTVMELLQIEHLGWSPAGESSQRIKAGEFDRTGKRPINASGGLKACGHPLAATGVRQIAELTRQLRGEAGERQLDRHQTGLAVNIGSLIGSLSVHILQAGK